MPRRLEEEKIYLNALNLIFQNNFLQLFRFVFKFDSFKRAFDNLNTKQELNPFEEWKKLENNNIKFVLPEEDGFPPLLKQITNQPLGLYIKGQLPDFQNHSYLSVVGTRKISAYGKLVIEKLIKDLTPYNFVIVSGLALGVDTLSHKTTLNQQGKTIAVLGTGLDKIFPVNNEQLSEKIIQNGALVSEYPIGTNPLKPYFPWRNRIISGLSPATLVIEAPKKSGALITANFALEQNRDVFAVPGSIFNVNSLGANNLIKQGAKLINQVEDILEEYHISLTTRPSNSNIPVVFDSALEKQIYEFFSFDEPIVIDKIAERVNLKTNEILIALTALEMKELIKDIGGGKYVKITNN